VQLGLDGDVAQIGLHGVPTRFGLDGGDGAAGGDSMRSVLATA
jgi:hypothetical protein